MTDLALVGAHVRTLDPERPSATAVAITGGTIDRRRLGCRDPRAVRDAPPRSSTCTAPRSCPGSSTATCTRSSARSGARGADLMGVSSLAEVQRLVAEERARCAPHEWVLGFGLDYNAFAEIRLQRRR